MTAKFADVEEYLASFPDEVRPVLEGVRRAIRDALPDAEETIAYDMPTYKVGGRSVVHFAGWKSYVSLYPLPGPSGQRGAGPSGQRGAGPSGQPGAGADLEADLAPYRATKGTGRFPLDEPIPYELITRVVRALRVERLG